MMETTEKVFITEIIKDGERYKSPEIKAMSWKEAEAKAKETIVFLGELG